MFLIRPRAWWFNKAPLSVMTFFLLIDGRPLTLGAAFALFCLVGIVCSVANFGYALNELYDLEEDRRGGRKNAAEAVSAQRMWAIIGGSAAIALALAAAGAGWRGLALASVELLLPLTYSIPPWRTKERGWLGVFSDALAAHVFPAMIALIIFSHLSLRPIAPALPIAAAVWALATGLRGILSHQLQAEQHDKAAGLVTVVHRIGHAKLAGIVIGVILPVEVIAFSALALQADTTQFFRAVACVYLLYELLKYLLNAFPVVVFTPAGQRYVPFVNEGFYKVWGPLAFAADGAFTDWRFLIFVPIILRVFWARVLHEPAQMALTAQALSKYWRGASAGAE